MGTQEIQSRFFSKHSLFLTRLDFDCRCGQHMAGCAIWRIALTGMGGIACIAIISFRRNRGIQRRRMQGSVKRSPRWCKRSVWRQRLIRMVEGKRGMVVDTVKGVMVVVCVRGSVVVGVVVVTHTTTTTSTCTVVGLQAVHRIAHKSLEATEVCEASGGGGTCGSKARMNQTGTSKHVHNHFVISLSLFKVNATTHYYYFFFFFFLSMLLQLASWCCFSSRSGFFEENYSLRPLLLLQRAASASTMVTTCFELFGFVLNPYGLKVIPVIVSRC